MLQYVHAHVYIKRFGEQFETVYPVQVVLVARTSKQNKLCVLVMSMSVQQVLEGVDLRSMRFLWSTLLSIWRQSPSADIPELSNTQNALLPTFQWEIP